MALTLTLLKSTAAPSANERSMRRRVDAFVIYHFIFYAAHGVKSH